MTFMEIYDKIMNETYRREHATLEQLMLTFNDILQSVGAYTDDKLGTDKIKANALSSATKYDRVASQLKTEFKKAGVNKTYREQLLKNGYESIVKILDDEKLWTDYPTTS